MQRRGFLGGAGLVGLAVATEAGCGRNRGGRDGVATLDDTELEGWLAQLDGALAGIDDARPMRLRGREQLPQPERDQLDRFEQLGRDGVASLLVTGMVRDLPAENRSHPHVMRRVEGTAPRMDSAVLGAMGLLENLTASELADLESEVRERPELPMRVLERIDRMGEQSGAPLRRRIHLRAMAQHVMWRLQHQPAQLLIDETLDKTRRLVARNGVGLERIREQTRAAYETLLFGPTDACGPRSANGPTAIEAPLDYDDPTLEQTDADGVADPTTPAAPLGRTPEPDPAADREYLDARQRSGRRLLIAGGSVLGGSVGATALGLGLLLGAGSIVGAVFLTIGGILLVIGLVILIVGAVRRARALRRLREIEPA